MGTPSARKGRRSLKCSCALLRCASVRFAREAAGSGFMSQKVHNLIPSISCLISCSISRFSNSPITYETSGIYRERFTYPFGSEFLKYTFSRIWRVHEYEKLQVQEIENKAVLRRFAQHIHEA